MSDECPTCDEHDGNPMELNIDLEDLMQKWQLSPTELLAAVGDFIIAYTDAVNDSYICLDCRRHTGAIGEYFMLTDELWAKVTPDYDGSLCIRCTESRLGRRLNEADFPLDIPLNAMIRSGEWSGSPELLEAMNRAH